MNNAIKYADVNYILVALNYNVNVLSLAVDDYGKGFDDSILNKVPKNNSEGGMGLFFMKERINYINGRLFINSIPGERLCLNPITSLVAQPSFFMFRQVHGNGVVFKVGIHIQDILLNP